MDEKLGFLKSCGGVLLLVSILIVSGGLFPHWADSVSCWTRLKRGRMQHPPPANCRINPRCNITGISCLTHCGCHLLEAEAWLNHNAKCNSENDVDLKE
uniref:Uncharacterized protein n=1 Tax=Salix viminalis TaxID=40686 RepID=A0A6N2K3Q9_SALVM